MTTSRSVAICPPDRSADGPRTSEVGVPVIETALRERLGHDVVVVSLRQIRPWTVARCELEGGGAPRTVIVKWLRSNPEGFRVERRQIATEVAALRIVNAVAPDVAPRLIAHHLDRDLLILEDLAPRRTLHSVLSTGIATPGGVSGLHAFASTMGRLHSATRAIAAPEPSDRIMRTLLPRDVARSLLADLAEITGQTHEVRSDVDAALTELEEPGDLAALSNGDSGANNCLVDAARADARLIDFEHACRRHVLLDAAALHVPGSMWMTIADPVDLGVEATYRRTAGVGLPRILDDEAYGFGLCAASGVTTLEKLRRFEKLDRREPGHHSRAQLISTIDRAVTTMRRWGHLGAFGSWLDGVGAALRRRWPDADVEFPNDYTLREPFDPEH